MISFKEWLIKEGGKGSGTKVSATGLRAGGQAQAGMGMYKPSKPQIKPINYIKKIYS